MEANKNIEPEQPAENIPTEINISQENILPESTIITQSGMDNFSLIVMSLEITTLILCCNGLDLLGSDCQVFLPIMTAFCLSLLHKLVVLLKKTISPLTFQGIFPSLPIPNDVLDTEAMIANSFIST